MPRTPCTYGPDDCYKKNTGDSAVAMARFWWVDQLARYVVGKTDGFGASYDKIRSDLLAHTWLTERYDSEGKRTRAPYYHEYPEILTMVLREMIYGIDVKLDAVTIRPFGTDRYDYNVGGLTVSFSRDAVRMTVPGSGTRTYKVHGLVPDAAFVLSTGGSVKTDREGVATFRAGVGSPVSVTLVQR